jgi:hypothetical protein
MARKTKKKDPLEADFGPGPVDEPEPARRRRARGRAPYRASRAPATAAC